MAIYKSFQLSQSSTIIQLSCVSLTVFINEKMESHRFQQHIRADLILQLTRWDRKLHSTLAFFTLNYVHLLILYSNKFSLSCNMVLHVIFRATSFFDYLSFGISHWLWTLKVDVTPVWAVYCDFSLALLILFSFMAVFQP